MPLGVGDWFCFSDAMLRFSQHRVKRYLQIFLIIFSSRFFSTRPALLHVFALGVGDGLPLHIARPIRATQAQRLDVIDNPARARAIGLPG